MPGISLRIFFFFLLLTFSIFLKLIFVNNVVKSFICKTCLAGFAHSHRRNYIWFTPFTFFALLFTAHCYFLFFSSIYFLRVWSSYSTSLCVPAVSLGFLLFFLKPPTIPSSFLNLRITVLCYCIKMSATTLNQGS